MAERFPFNPFKSLPARNSLNPGDRNTSPRLEDRAMADKSALELSFASWPLEYQAALDKYKSALEESSVSLHLAHQVEELKHQFDGDFRTEGETSSAVQLQGSRLDVGALTTSARVHSFPLEQCSIDVVEKVSDRCLNNDTRDSLSQSTLDKLFVWLKENFSRDRAIYDPTLLKTLFGSDVFLSAGMISKYTPGSLPVEILQSLAIGFAIVGVIASATGLYLIFRQRRSLPFSFEREASKDVGTPFGFERQREALIQTLEDVGTSATGFAFVGGMSLLLPNNISRCIVAGVLCAVLFFIIIFVKLRPKKEAETEPAGSQGPTDLASNPFMVPIELANLSGAIYSPGAI